MRAGRERVPGRADDHADQRCRGRRCSRATSATSPTASAPRRELRASRARIVEAADDERAAGIERDLHDGAQQRLSRSRVTCGWRAPRDPAARPRCSTSAIARARRGDRRAARARARDPSGGPDRARPRARRSRARWPGVRSPVRARRGRPAERLPAQVEAAAYFLVAEALTNVARHARRRAASRSGSPRDGDAVASRCATTGAAAPTGRRLGPARTRRPRRGARRGLDVDSPPGEGTTRACGAAMRVVIAEDSVLLREGVARLLEEAGFEVVGQAGDAEDLLRKVARAPARRRRGRHPHAADAHRRGAAGGAGRSAPSCPGTACSCSRSTSRSDTRCELLARRRRGRRLPAQGPGRRRRPLHGRDPRGRRRRVGARPRGRRQMVGRRHRHDPLAGLTRARARGARADGRGPVEPRDRRTRVPLRTRGRTRRHGDLRQAAPARLAAEAPARARRPHPPALRLSRPPARAGPGAYAGGPGRPSNWITANPGATLPRRPALCAPGETGSGR